MSDNVTTPATAARTPGVTDGEVQSRGKRPLATRQGDVYSVRVTRHTGVILIGFTSRKWVQGTADECRTALRSALIHNALLGWWSFISLLFLNWWRSSENIRAWNQLDDLAGPSDGEADQRGSFRADVTPRGIVDSISAYIGRLRSGDPGGLPSVLGLIVLGVIFASTTTDFLSRNNIANLLSQASFIALIALGLVFVLLLGEIDLSAGTTAGMCAAFAAQGLASKDLHKGVGNIVYVLLIIGLAAAVLMGLWNRMIVAPAVVAIGLILLLTGASNHHQPLAFLFAVSIGVAVGTFSGVLVARLGIPSFIVTLALFLSWEGVELYALKNQSVGTSGFNIWFDLTHGTMAVWAGWLFFVVIAGGYTVVTFLRAGMRRRAGLSGDTVPLVALRAGVVIVLGALITWFLNQSRFGGIKGIPWAASVPIGFMVIWTLVLSKTTWGRHLYAIGGNAEAARRAGIGVDRAKINAFAIGSGMAAVGGLFLADFSGGATTGLGQGDILLFAVAAAVIGGTSLFGGRGKPRDAIVGAFVIATIPNGIHLHAFPEQANEVITGVVLLLAATVDAISRRRAKAS